MVHNPNYQISENAFLNNHITTVGLNNHKYVQICYSEELKNKFFENYQICLAYPEKSVKYK